MWAAAHTRAGERLRQQSLSGAGHISKGPCRDKRKRRDRGLFIVSFYSGFRLPFRPYGSSQRSLNTANR